jgi:hypothetical protein
MAKRRLAVTGYLNWFMITCLVISYHAPVVVYGQGEEQSAEEASPGRGGINSVFQRFFGPRETTAEAGRASAPRNPPRVFKPGAFQGGMMKQLRSTLEEVVKPGGDGEDSLQVAGEEAPRGPLSPSRMAQRAAPLEPFTKPQPPRESAAAPGSNSTSGKRETSSPTGVRDIFAEDPPSLVGTGIDARRSGGGSGASGGLRSFDPPVASRTAKANAANPSRADTDADGSEEPLRMASKPATPAWNNAVQEEAPKVSRKAVPAKDSTLRAPLAGNASSSGPLGETSSRSSPKAPASGPERMSSYPGASSSQSTNSMAVGSRPTTPSSPSNVSPNPPKTGGLGGMAEASPSGRTPVVGGTPARNAGAPVTGTPSAAAGGLLASADSNKRLEMSIPKVNVSVLGPPSMQVGKAAPYEVIVKNDGAELLSGVLVSLVLPASVKSSLPVVTAGEFETDKTEQGAENLLWHVTEIAPGQSKAMRVSFEATKPEHFAVDIEWTVLPQTGQLQLNVHQPQLNLAIEGPSSVLWGKPEIYRLRIRNPGNADVKDVDVQLAAGAYGSSQSKIGDIPAGSEKIVEVELTFQHSGAIQLSGLASSKSDGLDSQAAIEVAVQQVELAAVWEGLAQQYQGSVAEQRLTVSNQSQVVTENVACLVSIPSGLKIVSLPPDAKLEGNQVRWVIPNLGAKTSKTFAFTFQAIQAGPMKLSGEARSAGGGEAKVDTLIQVDAISDLKLMVTDPMAPAPVGQEVVYDLTIINRGSKAATAVQLLAQFSNGIEPLRAEGSASRVLPGQVVFDPIAVIEPGQEVTLRVVAQASEPGMHRFRAELQCEDGETQLIQEESTRYLSTATATDSSAVRR